MSFYRGIHPPYPIYPGIQQLERERLGLPPGPPHGMELSNEQMVSVVDVNMLLLSMSDVCDSRIMTVKVS
jgi:hypothetical protein